jgi:hypothetical protein
MWDVAYGWLIAVGLVAFGTCCICSVKFIRRRGADRGVGKIAAYSGLAVVAVAGLMFLVSAAESSLPPPSKWWPFGTTDKDRVPDVISDVLYYTQEADVAFNAGTEAIGSLRAGRPAYQVADMLKPQCEQLDKYVPMIAWVAEEKAKKIEDPVARQHTQEGARAAFNVYEGRRVFLQNVRAAVSANDKRTFREVMKKRQAEDVAETVAMLNSIGAFMKAKKAVGLPETLTEPQQ